MEKEQFDLLKEHFDYKIDTVLSIIKEMKKTDASRNKEKKEDDANRDKRLTKIENKMVKLIVVIFLIVEGVKVNVPFLKGLF